MYIITKEGDRLAISHAVIEYNSLLHEVFDNDHSELSLSIIATKDFVRIIQFCNYYNRNPFTSFHKPVTKFNIEDSWYHTFVDMSRQDLFDLINAANYLDNKPLLELLSAKLKTMLTGLTINEIKDLTS